MASFQILLGGGAAPQPRTKISVAPKARHFFRDFPGKKAHFSSNYISFTLILYKNGLKNYGFPPFIGHLAPPPKAAEGGLGGAR